MPRCCTPVTCCTCNLLSCFCWLKDLRNVFLCRYKLSPVGLSGESFVAKLAEAMFQVRNLHCWRRACRARGVVCRGRFLRHSLQPCVTSDTIEAQGFSTDHAKAH